MNTLKLILENIDKVAGQFLQKNNHTKIFAVYGTMGAGKTTFIKALCKQLNVVDNVASPTFAIVHEYNTLENDRIYHFDFYRLKKEEEILDIGFYDYMTSGSYCFIEWPEIGEKYLPLETQKVKIEVDENDNRSIKW